MQYYFQIYDSGVSLFEQYPYIPAKNNKDALKKYFDQNNIDVKVNDIKRMDRGYNRHFKVTKCLPHSKVEGKFAQAGNSIWFEEFKN